MDETERAMLAFKAMIVAGIALVILGQASNFFAWWNDFGDLTTWLGLFLGALGVAATLLLSATRGQRSRVAVAIGEGNAMQRGASGMHRESLDLHREGRDMHRRSLEQHDETNGKLDAMVRVLREISDRL